MFKRIAIWCRKLSAKLGATRWCNESARSYAGIGKILGTYWAAYGGAKKLATSPYLHASVLITVITAPLWSEAGWWDLVLAVMPNVLGFSLGGYAIWLAIGDDRFRSIIAGGSRDGKTTSPFLGVNSAFVHFIVLQVVSILLALLASAYPSETPNVLVALIWGLFFGVFVYALMSALAATLTIFRAATWYEKYLESNQKKEHEKQGDESKDRHTRE